MDKGIKLQKELAMPQYAKSAEKEATGKAPDSFEGSSKTVVKNVEKSGGYCGVKNAK
jgi:hypothetical protein